MGKSRWGISITQLDKAREAGLRGTYPKVEKCEKCHKRKVKHHHYLCDRCYDERKRK